MDRINFLVFGYMYNIGSYNYCRRGEKVMHDWHDWYAQFAYVLGTAWPIIVFMIFITVGIERRRIKEGEKC
jgi:hypothetical protein